MKGGGEEHIIQSSGDDGDSESHRHSERQMKQHLQAYSIIMNGDQLSEDGTSDSYEKCTVRWENN